MIPDDLVPTPRVGCGLSILLFEFIKLKFVSVQPLVPSKKQKGVLTHSSYLHIDYNYQQNSYMK